MTVYHRWWVHLWPWSVKPTEPQPPAPPPPPARPSWADERTANLRPLPLFTHGQAMGYRVPRNRGRHHVR
ncbi:hypothetical protein ACIBF5_08205 [Micromonospora sp. NPDC050417]|uniref:hypothetical protein n=1 Tax=Micromonospora sp. NPDC050417 TaxID=3364280 RepID=UPI0037B4B8D3